jgi:hypothetical protein
VEDAADAAADIAGIFVFDVVFDVVEDVVEDVPSCGWPAGVVPVIDTSVALSARGGATGLHRTTTGDIRLHRAPDPTSQKITRRA